MKFRLGLVVGFGVGYYFGSAAGRERHEQINRLLVRLRGADRLENATVKARAVVDLSMERARDLVAGHHPDNPAVVNGGEVSYSSSR